MAYIWGILKKRIPSKVNPSEPPQKEPPAPKAKAKTQHEPEPAPDNEPPQYTEDDPVITDANFFEVDPDMEAIHEAWLKLSEEERRRNWDKAIAKHKQRR